MDEVEKLKKKLTRALKALSESENLLEVKSKELYLLNQSLEKKVKFRTQELEQAKDIAIKANKSKDRFVANISHELRTPLNGIIGILGFLKKTNLNSEQKDFIETILQSSDTLLDLINDLLDQSKISFDKISIESKSFDLEKTSEAVINVLYFKALESGVSLNLYFSPETPTTIISDQKKISQILMNLVGNAIKFTPKGHVKIIVSSKKNKIVFEIIDSGVGIPKDKLKLIFKPFQQLDDSDSRKYGGSGLGLSIAKAFVEILGGEISAQSKEGEGTTFRFTVDLIKDDCPKVNNEQRFSQSDKTIVCVSNKNLEEIILNYLKRWNTQSIAFLNLSEVIQYIKNHKNIKHLIISKNLVSDIALLPMIPNIHLISSPADEINTTDKRINIWREPFFRSDLIKILEPKHLNKEPVKKNTQGTVETKKNNPLTSCILLVEDNLINQKVASFIIQESGYEVIIANNGSEALELCKKNFYPLILMDYHMPIMDGLEATKAIRILQNESQKSYIIAMTANAMKSAKEECFEAGMDDFITKPVNADFLTEKIQRALARLS